MTKSLYEEQDRYLDDIKVKVNRDGQLVDKHFTDMESEERIIHMRDLDSGKLEDYQIHLLSTIDLIYSHIPEKESRMLLINSLAAFVKVLGEQQNVTRAIHQLPPPKGGGL